MDQTRQGPIAVPFQQLLLQDRIQSRCIINHFDGFHTNAIAESTNAKIQIAAIKNRGSRNLDFFPLPCG